ARHFSTVTAQTQLVCPHVPLQVPSSPLLLPKHNQFNSIPLNFISPCIQILGICCGFLHTDYSITNRTTRQHRTTIQGQIVPDSMSKIINKNGGSATIIMLNKVK